MLRDGKKFVDDRYRTKTEDVEPGEVSDVLLQHHTVDITYRSRVNNRHQTIRSHGAIGPTEYNDVPEGYMGFWDDGTHYAYGYGDVRLVSLEADSPRTLAEGDEIIQIERVQFPQRAPVEGAVQKDVTATVYYWSPRSDALQSVEINVTRLEESERNPWRIVGKDVTDSDRRIEAAVRYEREITARGFGGPEVTLGRTARIEFPEGHRFTVDIGGLKDDRTDSAVESIKSRLTKRRGYNDVTVTHEGRIPEE